MIHISGNIHYQSFPDYLPRKRCTSCTGNQINMIFGSVTYNLLYICFVLRKCYGKRHLPICRSIGRIKDAMK